MGLEKELILLEDEVALVGGKLDLVGEKLGGARSSEVKNVEGVVDKGELITDEGWV